ncbi:hypothetical protein ACP70R_032287 [Stipagrostis hirtigluma subsp. patula]
MAPKRREPVAAAAAPPGSKRARLAAAAEPPPSPGARRGPCSSSSSLSDGRRRAPFGRVLQAMWGKLERIEEQLRALTQKVVRFPKLNDRVHRLEEISKDGKYCKRLEKEKIRTVEDSLKALNKDPDNLAKILQINKEHKPWERMVRHARKCCLKGKHKLKSYPWKKQNVVLYFNCVHDLVGAEFGGHHTYIAQDKFDFAQQVLVDELKGGAYDHLDTLRPDHVMTETDNFPRPLNMDAGAAHQVGVTPAVEDLSKAQIESSCATASNDPGPSSSVPDHNCRHVYQGLSLLSRSNSPRPRILFGTKTALDDCTLPLGQLEEFLFRM